jgi:hypothetical protein
MRPRFSFFGFKCGELQTFMPCFRFACLLTRTVC